MEKQEIILKTIDDWLDEYGLYHKNKINKIIHFAENIDFDILVFIQCTSPLIKPQDINKGIEKMKNFDSIVSVTETHQMFWNVDGPLYDINKRLRRQDSKKRYLETGEVS